MFMHCHTHTHNIMYLLYPVTGKLGQTSNGNMRRLKTIKGRKEIWKKKKTRLLLRILAVDCRLRRTSFNDPLIVTICDPK